MPDHDEPARDHASPVRSVFQAVAALSAFAPVATLVPAAGVSPMLPRNVFGLGTAVALATAWSISEERWADAQDRDLARIASRFSPLAVGAAFAVIAALEGSIGWSGLKVLVAFAVVLMPFVHVGRVRAIQTFVCGVILIGAVVIEPASAWALLPFSFAVAATSALDRDGEARVAAGLGPRPSLAVPLGLTAGVVALGSALFALAAWLLPELRPLGGPRRGRPFDVPSAEGTGLDASTWIQLAGVLLLLGAALVVYHFLAERRRRAKMKKEEEELPPMGEPLAAAPPVDPDVANELPPGARREIVRRYLRHLAALRGRGIPRPASGTPRELARFVEKRVTTTRELPRDLAHAFERARWSSVEPVRDGEARLFEERADAVEREV